MKARGFTLIEVLIALGILAIAITAIIQATSQNIKNTAYLEDKTIATLVGTEIINKTRLGLLILPFAPDKYQENSPMLGKTWGVEASLTVTPNTHINEIHVNIFRHQHAEKLITLIGYQYVV